MNANKTNTSETPMRFKAGAVDKLTYALQKFGDQQIHAILTFDGTFDELRLKKAFRMILDAEPGLGSKFVYHPKKPYWERRTDLDEIDYLTLVKVKDFQKQLFDFIVTPCNPEVDLPIQLRILREEKQDSLVIKTSHAVIDGGGIQEFIAFLGLVYQELKIDQNYSLPINHGSRDLKQVLKRFNFFQKMFIFLKNVSSKPNWAFPWIGTKQEKPNYILRRFPPEVFRKLKTFGKKFGATINDMILTVFYRAIFELIKPKPSNKLVTVVTINLRSYLPNQRGESLCNLSTAAYPEVSYIPNEDFDKTLVRVRDEMKFRKSSAPGIGPAVFINNVFRMRFDKVVNSIRKRCLKDLKRNATHPVFTNVGLIRTEDFNFGDIKPFDGYLMTPIMKAPGFIFGVMTFNENLSISSGFYEGSYDKATFEKFFDLVEKELKAIKG